MDYQDFEIEITSQGDGRHHVNVLQTPAGETRQQLAFGWDDAALRGKLAALEGMLHFKQTDSRAQRQAKQTAVETFGGDLFDALFNDDLKSLYSTSWYMAEQNDRGLRLKLRLQSALLAAVPWELLYDRRFGEFLCTSRQLSIVRYVALPRAVQLLATKPPLHILGVVAAPDNLPPLDVAQEKRQMAEAVQPLVAQGLASLTWLEQPNWRALMRAMRRGPWHVLHYVGHSGFDEALDEGYLSLEDANRSEERLSAAKLATLLADHGTLRLVVLNACKGGRIGSDLYSSMAATLVRRGIPAVVGMQYDISDAAALEFALTFYEVLAENFPVEAALADARKAISIGVADSAEWGTPVFYTHAPQSVLFDMQDVVTVVDTAVLDRLSLRTEQSLDAVARVDELLSALWRLAPALQQQPDPGVYAALGAAVGEVVKTWAATDGAFRRVRELYKADGDLKDASDGLLDIGDFGLRAEVAAGRGHCHRIGEIYWSTLRPWFDTHPGLSQDDRQLLERLFASLTTADDDIFWQMEQVAEQVETAADQVLALVEDGREDEARTVAKGLRREIRPLRAAINRSLVDLQRFKVELQGVARPETASGGDVAGPAQDDIDRWTQALEQTPSIQNRDLRQAIIQELPLSVRNALNTNLPTLNAQLRDLVRTCRNYPEGMAALVTAVRTIEGPSLAVLNLEALLSGAGAADATAVGGGVAAAERSQARPGLDLLDKLDSAFDEDQLRELSFALDVTYDNLGGRGKRARALDLIQTLESGGRIDDLILYCKRVRPNVTWD